MLAAPVLRQKRCRYLGHTSYDAVGNLISDTNELGWTTTFSYDALNRRTGQLNVHNNVRTYGYNAAGKLISETDEELRTTAYGYDNLYRRTTTLDAAGGLWTKHYDPNGNVDYVTDARGHQTNFAYDALDRLTQTQTTVTDVDGKVHDVISTTGYDAVGNVLLETDAEGRSTQHTYDPLNRRETTTNALNGVTTFQYDRVGNLLKTTDPLHRTAEHTYDALNRRLSTLDAENGLWITGYDAVGNKLLSTDANNHDTRFAYDRLNRLTSVEDAAGHKAYTTYDDVGNVITETDRNGLLTTHKYDELNRRVRTTNSLLLETTTVYDKVGNPLTVTAPLSRTTSYEYDSLNRVTKITDAEGGQTSSSYDSSGNRIALSDPVGNTTTWTYDELNRVIKDKNALSNVREFTYDKVGNLKRRQDRRGWKIEYTVDALNRRTEERWLDPASGQVAHTITFAFDAASQLTGANDFHSSYVYTYDNVGRAVSVQHDIAYLVQTVRLDQFFDSVGNRTQLDVTVGGVADSSTAYVYDVVDRMLRIEQTGTPSGEKRVDFAWDLGGRPTSVTRYSDLAGLNQVFGTTYAFDAGSRLTSLAHAKSPTTLASYSWTYDDADRLTQAVSNDGTVTFTYDKTDQITGADYTFQTNETFAYDANGNRQSAGYLTGTNNETTSDGTYNYVYDTEGNRTLRTHIASGSVTEYEWDHRNRLAKLIERDTAGGPATKTVEYRYDPFDRRIAKVISPVVGPANVEHFIYDGAGSGVDGDQNATLRFDSSSQVVNRYLHGHAIDMILADEQSSGGGTNVLWPLTDNLGTVRDVADVINGATTIVNHLVYNAFGTVTSETNAAVDLIFGFTGRERDGESDLYYYRARYYDPALGQFTSEDPIGFEAGDANVRRYVGNSPTNATDPSGLEIRRTKESVRDRVSSTWSMQFLQAAKREVDQNKANVINPFSKAFIPWQIGVAMLSSVDTVPVAIEESASLARQELQRTADESDSVIVKTVAPVGKVLTTAGEVNAQWANAMAVGNKMRIVPGVEKVFGNIYVRRLAVGGAMGLGVENAIDEYQQDDFTPSDAFYLAGSVYLGYEYAIDKWPRYRLSSQDLGERLFGIRLGNQPNLPAAPLADDLSGQISPSPHPPSILQSSRQWFVAPKETVLRQTAGTGSEWYEHFARKYGAENVDWVSGSGRTIDWPSELPHPGTNQMFRVAPERKPWYLFHRELEGVSGPRPAAAIGHHNQPLYLNGVDDGALNGSWQFNPAHQIGHGQIDPRLSRLPLGTEIRIKPTNPNGG